MGKCVVIAGDYEGCEVIVTGNKFHLMRGMKRTEFDKSMVNKYELVDDLSKSSLWSAVVRGGVGGIFFGPLGAVAGAATAKKQTEYLFSVEYTAGGKSLMSLDADTYRKLLRLLY